MGDRHDITHLLVDYRGGDREALDQLFPMVYEELRRIAHNELRRERPGHTLATSGLVHEAYLRLVDQARASPGDRARFFAVAATVMRRVLIEYARRRHALKRGGGKQPLSLDDAISADDRATESLLALDDALTQLGALNERLRQVVECRFFGGLSEEETAAALEITPRTVRRDWVKARGWLYQQLQDQAS
jgi:RNA polymerase sigma factor (TIGR02999 family)